MSLPADGQATLFPGVPYEYAAVATPGSLIFTAGACPLDHDGAVVGPGDPVEQTGVAVENLVAALAIHGAGPEHLVRTTVYVVGDRDDLATVWATVARRLAPHRPPSTLLGVATLGYPNQLVEIDGIASLSPPRALDPAPDPEEMTDDHGPARR